MKAHTSYKIYPKAIEEFINDHYNLSTINFGNIEKNLKAILQKLKLDHILECEWDVNPLFFFDKVDIDKNNNKPTDFDQYSNFTFIFKSLNNEKSTKEYEDAIEKLEKEFIIKYQTRISSDYKALKELELKKKKRMEFFAYALVGIAFIALASIVLFVKFSKE